MKNYSGKIINANLIEGIKISTGKLEFQENGLLFKADSVNGIMKMPIILYTDIKLIESKNTMGIVPNGISISTKEGSQYFFVVFDRKNIIEYISNRINQLSF